MKSMTRTRTVLPTLIVGKAQKDMYLVTVFTLTCSTLATSPRVII